MNATLRLGIRNALHPVHAGFEFQLGERASTLHLGDDFLEPAHGAFACRDHVDFPALQRGKSFIHAEQVAGEQRGLVTSSTGADFQHHISFVHRILGQQRDADLLGQFEAAGSERVALGFRHAAHFGFGRGIGDQRVDLTHFLGGGAIGLDGFDQRIEFGQFPRDPHIVFRVDLPKQLRLQRSVVRQQDIKFGFGQHRHELSRN